MNESIRGSIDVVEKIFDCVKEEFGNIIID